MIGILTCDYNPNSEISFSIVAVQLFEPCYFYRASRLTRFS